VGCGEEEQASRALSGFLLEELLMLLLLVTLKLGDKCRRDMVEAVVLGEGMLSALASASSSDRRREDEPARLMRGLRILMDMRTP
jgi:hypothetical protein